MPKPDRLSQVRVVPGRIWMMGKEYQDREWKIVRDAFDRAIVAGGYKLISKRESREVDEQRREVILRIEAEGLRELGNVWIAPLGTKPSEDGWKLIGWTDEPFHFVPKSS